jgi:hypothetical protein
MRAVPPRRVRLADDVAVIRKFLKIFGCSMTDVAVDLDGIGAVTKTRMNLEKYDLVLMVNPFLLTMHVWS